jgi:hypothetical protein
MVATRPSQGPRVDNAQRILVNSCSPDIRLQEDH